MRIFRGFGPALLLGATCLATISWMLAAQQPFGSNAVAPRTLVCTTAEDAKLASAAATRVNEAIPALEAMYDASRAFDGADAADGAPADFTPPQVSEGCEEPFRLPEASNIPGIAFEPRYRAYAPTNLQTGFHIYVVVLSEADADRLLGDGSPWLRAAYAYLCDENGSGCREVATALYVRSSTLSQEDVFARGLGSAFGLNRLLDYPDGHPPSESGKTKTPAADQALE